MKKEIKVKVRRFDPSTDNESSIQEYVVPVEEGMSVANVLDWIADNDDPSLAFYSSCRTGKCKACLIRINGEANMVCTEMVTGDLELEAIDSTRIIKDLVCASKVGIQLG